MDEVDRKKLAELVLAHRLATSLLVYPTVWRVRLLLSSRVWTPEVDTRIWEAGGKMVGFAMLWRRSPNSPYLVFDHFVHPLFASPELFSRMIGWADRRARDIAGGQSEPMTIYTNAPTLTVDTSALLRLAGFEPFPANLDGRNVYFSRPLDDPLPSLVSPPGVTVRPLQSESEIEAYQALSGFSKVSPSHLSEAFFSDEYRHLVAVNMDGDYLGYAEASICRAEWQAGRERIGWIDYIETLADYQRQGIGQALALGALRTLKDWNAKTAMLVTITTNSAATGLYRKMGFKPTPVNEAPSYEKRISGDTRTG
jgi:ribosomal protein S18 acetylase RimI-like enzyme